MKRLTTIAVSLLLLCAITPAVFAADASVKVINNTKWDVHHMMFSPVGDDEWGADQLGEHTLTAKGGTFTLKGIPCDSYDVKVVDEDGDECVVEAVDLCSGHHVWMIDDKDLLACEGYGE
jgi:hypothetical protein